MSSHYSVSPGKGWGMGKRKRGKGRWGRRAGPPCATEKLETREVAFLTHLPVLSPRFSDAIFQIDFPTSAFDIKFTSPPGDKFSPRYEFGSLREEDQRVLKNIMQKESLYWWVLGSSPCVAQALFYPTSHLPAQVPALGAEVEWSGHCPWAGSRRREGSAEGNLQAFFHELTLSRMERPGSGN